MNVEYTVLKRGFDLHKKEYEDAALRALRSGWYIMGPELDAFEKEFASYTGTGYCVGLNSGTDALILAFRALGIGPGDEVIVPAGTYIASVIGITESGATPVFVDSDEYLLMDADQIENKITERTKAILPVHLYGQACRMDKIAELAKKYGLYIVEDCAQSHGATWRGKKTGTFGTIGCFSFYPTKPLGAFGDAGAIVTDDAVLAEKIRMLRNYGSKIKYYNEMNGLNSRLDEVQAALLRTGLTFIDDGNAERIRIAEKYLKEIRNKSVKLPAVAEGASDVYHLFPVLVDDRDGLQQYLLENGVKTQVHYPIPPYVAECYKSWNLDWEDFPNASYIAQHELSLPIYAGMPEDEIVWVIEMVNKYQG